MSLVSPLRTLPAGKEKEKQNQTYTLLFHFKIVLVCLNWIISFKWHLRHYKVVCLAVHMLFLTMPRLVWLQLCSSLKWVLHYALPCFKYLNHCIGLHVIWICTIISSGFVLIYMGKLNRVNIYVLSSKWLLRLISYPSQNNVFLEALFINLKTWGSYTISRSSRWL